MLLSERKIERISFHSEMNSPDVFANAPPQQVPSRVQLSSDVFVARAPTASAIAREMRNQPKNFEQKNDSNRQRARHQVTIPKLLLNSHFHLKTIKYGKLVIYLIELNWK